VCPSEAAEALAPVSLLEVPIRYATSTRTVALPYTYHVHTCLTSFPLPPPLCTPPASDLDKRVGVCYGSADEVERFKTHIFA